VTNLQPEKTAQDWVRNGFAPEEVWRYLEARCPIPCKAAELRANGITPDMAAEHYGYDEDDFPMTLGVRLIVQVKWRMFLQICLISDAVISVRRHE